MSHPDIKVTVNPRPTGWRERFPHYVALIRLNRPIGILLLLWPALWALWIAGEGSPPWHVVLIFSLGVALMRSAGCAINDYADRNFDGHVERTCHRPLATGRLRPGDALWTFLILSLAAFGLVLLLNWQTVLMSTVAVLLAGTYPFMKRHTHLPQVVLGAAFGWAVPMAFTALHGEVTPAAWLIFVATVIWALIYDTEYAMVDREDDLKIGIKSTAILFGRYDRLMIGVFQGTMLAILAFAGISFALGPFYYGGLAVAAVLAIQQQRLIRDRSREGCFRAFLGNNLFGMVIFVGILLHYLTQR